MSLVGPTDAYSRAKRLCVIYACHTIEASTQARIFRATKRRFGVLVYSGTFAEWLLNGRVTPLGDQFFAEEPTWTLRRSVQSGKYLAYALVRYGRYNAEGAVWKVLRLNVASGHREPAQPGPCAGGLAFLAPGVLDVVLTSSGGMAWIIGEKEYDPFLPNPSPGPAVYTVCEMSTRSKSPTVLAAGPTVEPKSLAAAPGHLYWMEGGIPHSAAIE